MWLFTALCFKSVHFFLIFQPCWQTFPDMVFYINGFAYNIPQTEYIGTGVNNAYVMNSINLYVFSMKEIIVFFKLPITIMLVMCGYSVMYTCVHGVRYSILVTIELDSRILSMVHRIDSMDDDRSVEKRNEQDDENTGGNELHFSAPLHVYVCVFDLLFELLHIYLFILKQIKQLSSIIGIRFRNNSNNEQNLG